MGGTAAYGLLLSRVAAAAWARPVRWPPAEPVKLEVAALPGSSGHRWVASRSAMYRLQSNDDSEEPCAGKVTTSVTDWY